MDQVKLVKESEYFFAWFLFWVCSTAVGMIAGFVAGAFAGGFLAVIGFEDPRIHAAGGAVAGFIVGIPISYAVFRVFVANVIVKRIKMRHLGERAGDAA